MDAHIFYFLHLNRGHGILSLRLILGREHNSIHRRVKIMILNNIKTLKIDRTKVNTAISPILIIGKKYYVLQIKEWKFHMYFSKTNYR